MTTSGTARQKASRRVRTAGGRGRRAWKAPISRSACILSRPRSIEASDRVRNCSKLASVVSTYSSTSSRSRWASARASSDHAGRPPGRPRRPPRCARRAGGAPPRPRRSCGRPRAGRRRGSCPAPRAAPPARRISPGISLRNCSSMPIISPRSIMQLRDMGTFRAVLHDRDDLVDAVHRIHRASLLSHDWGNSRP